MNLTKAIMSSKK